MSTVTSRRHAERVAITDGICRFFKSWFHCFDATVILAGFIIDVCLKNVLEEAGSIVIVLRLWRYAAPHFSLACFVSTSDFLPIRAWLFCTLSTWDLTGKEEGS